MTSTKTEGCWIGNVRIKKVYAKEEAVPAKELLDVYRDFEIYSSPIDTKYFVLTNANRDEITVLEVALERDSNLDEVKEFIDFYFFKVEEEQDTGGDGTA